MPAYIRHIGYHIFYQGRIGAVFFGASISGKCSTIQCIGRRRSKLISERRPNLSKHSGAVLRAAAHAEKAARSNPVVSE
eukprot:s182_g48.t1